MRRTTAHDAVRIGAGSRSVEGQNVVVETRYAERQFDRLPTLANELVRAKVEVIVTITTPAAVAARDATATIPIVMAGSADPVERGLIASLARPGGNITGVTNSPDPDFAAKQLQLLKEAAPRIASSSWIPGTQPKLVSSGRWRWWDGRSP